MSDKPKTDQNSDVRSDTKKPYERPAVIWGEDYKPMAFGISCAKQPGNPPCSPGPAVN
jgi:hypothetical protein